MSDFRPYRFSPITTKEGLLEVIGHIHFSCYGLCKQSFGYYLPNAGNMGVFCHYDDEFEILKKIRNEMTENSDNPDLKYFTLREPITIPAKGDIPEMTYTHLYIRKPDPYRYQTGDVDFYLDKSDYEKLKQEMLNGEIVTGARIFERPDLDMIELYNPDIDALGYISTNTMAEKVRIKLSDATKL
ncbi:MAG TPA: hypothetical protein VK497_06265 [Candidatus Saccharimonadales bacterium]|nr:hypothetical protein [Candidatus Saccharimonadales bacterium]